MSRKVCHRCFPGKPGRELIDCDGRPGFRRCPDCVDHPGFTEPEQPPQTHRHEQPPRTHRPERDAYYMEIAWVVSKRGSCLRRKVGAVLVRNDRIIATGYNGAVAGHPDCDVAGHELVDIDGRPSCQRTIHAETNAIVQCALEGVSSRGATLYTTASPCYNCAKIAAQAGINRVVYTDEYDGRQGGTSADVVSILRGWGIETKRQPKP